MRMAELEQAHRHGIDRSGVEADIREVRRGHFLGALVSISCISGAIFTAYIGAHWAVSIALVGVPVMGAIKAFINQKK